MALSTEISLSVIATLSKASDLAPGIQQLDYRKRYALASGTGAGKADMLWNDTRTINASSSEDLDLVGALTDAMGSTFAPVRIKALIIKAADGNANNVVCGGASATQWAALLGTTGTVTVRPGALFVAVAGKADATCYVSAAGATDLFKVANSGAGTSVTYDIIVVGCSA
jgi:hypothetical protein